MNAAPPPLPGPADSEEGGAFPRHAANACLAAPLIIFGLCALLSPVLGNHRDAAIRPVYLLFALVATGISLIGLVLGIVAMALARPGQRGSVIPRSLAGLALFGLLAAIAVPNFVHARTLALERKQSLDKIHEAAGDLRARTATMLTKGPGGSADTRELRRSLSEAAKKSSGDNAAILKASELYLERLQPAQQALAQATRDLAAAKVLSVATLERRDQIQERKAVVKRFLDVNEASRDVVLHGETYYSNQLAAAGVSSEQMQTALIGFEKSSRPQIPLILRVRDADGRMGQGMLAVLNLFDAQWGQWNYDATSHVVRFQDRATLDRYNALMADINAAGTAETDATKRLAAILRSGSSL